MYLNMIAFPFGIILPLLFALIPKSCYSLNALKRSMAVKTGLFLFLWIQENDHFIWIERSKYIFSFARTAKLYGKIKLHRSPWLTKTVGNVFVLVYVLLEMISKYLILNVVCVQCEMANMKSYNITLGRAQKLDGKSGPFILCSIPLLFFFFLWPPYATWHPFWYWKYPRK